MKNNDNETVVLTAYRLDVSALEAAYQTLNEQTMEMTSFSDSRITGNIHVTKPGRLIFTIAMDDGWTLFVDGEKAEPEAFGNAFLSVHLNEGEHEIELRYETPGFRLGAAVSGGCVAIFVLLMLIRRKRNCLL